ncbi:protein Vhl [Diorhabda carinulata]|uniref:protein Vhl n=1 Tax=Diorhabda sublineata TaxID=1163346 RepID=UPI0024E0E957|nr:protein Vhl [Diorhabda sublineata]XP_057657066.1 protein Vhl [Diorhabda carinulata]
MPEPNVILQQDEHRSGTTGCSAYVRFINKTNRVIEIVWINYSGHYVRYRVLQKNNFVDVNTYSSHLWVAFDYYTKDRLLINRQFVFNPKTIRQVLLEKYPDGIIPVDHEFRVRGYITSPLYSLRYCALLTVRNLLKTPEEADTLELPKQLVVDLKKVITLKNNLVHTLDSQRR